MRVYTREFKHACWPETTCDMFEEHKSELLELCTELDTLTVEDALDQIAEFQELNASWFDVVQFIPIAIISGSNALHAIGGVLQRRKRMFGWVAFHIRGLPNGFCTVHATEICYYAGAKGVRQRFGGAMSWLSTRRRISSLFLEEAETESFQKSVDAARETIRTYEILNNLNKETT